DEGPRERRHDGEAAARRIGFLGAHDLIAGLLPALILETHGGAEGDAIARGRRLDDLGRADLAFQIVDPRLHEALLLASRVILGILRQIAVGPRLRNGAGDGGTLDALQPVELFLEAIVPFASHRRARDGHAGYLSTGSVSPWILTWPPA